MIANLHLKLHFLMYSSTPNFGACKRVLIIVLRLYHYVTSCHVTVVRKQASKEALAPPEGRVLDFMHRPGPACILSYHFTTLNNIGTNGAHNKIVLSF
jgi:hypothetical protein